MVSAKQDRARRELIDSAAKAYRELFLLMQLNAASHWLMYELTFAQARALIVIASHPELSISQLARLLGVGKPTASVLVQQLVERGLVTRTTHEGDRRRMDIRLSEGGERLAAGHRRERESQWRRWLSRLDNHELHALGRGLRAFGQVIRSEMDDRQDQAA